MFADAVRTSGDTADKNRQKADQHDQDNDGLEVIADEADISKEVAEPSVIENTQAMPPVML